MFCSAAPAPQPPKAARAARSFTSCRFPFTSVIGAPAAPERPGRAFGRGRAWARGWFPGPSASPAPHHPAPAGSVVLSPRRRSPQDCPAGPSVPPPGVTPVQERSTLAGGAPGGQLYLERHPLHPAPAPPSPPRAAPLAPPRHLSLFVALHSNLRCAGRAPGNRMYLAEKRGLMSAKCRKRSQELLTGSLTSKSKARTLGPLCLPSSLR